MPTFTQSQLEQNPNLLRADGLNLSVQLWEHKTTGEQRIFDPSTGKLHEVQYRGELDHEEVLLNIHNTMLLRDIIDALPIGEGAKQSLKDRLKAGLLTPEAGLPA